MKSGKRCRIIAVALALCMSAPLAGCEALMEHEVITEERTKGKPEYRGFDDLPVGYNGPAVVQDGGVVIKDGGIADGVDHWNEFLKKTEEKTPCSIRIMQRVNPENLILRDVIYDGNTYRLIISTNPDKYDYTYSYLYDLRGRRSKNSRLSRVVFLTNEKDAKFEDVIGSLGKNEESQKLNFQLLFREN